MRYLGASRLDGAEGTPSATGQVLTATGTTLNAYSWAATSTLAPTFKTAAYTAVKSDYVLADATSAAFTVTLPATPNAGDTVGVKKTDASVNIVTVVGQSSTTIDGDPNVTLVSKDAACLMTFNGTNWFIRSGYADATGGTGMSVDVQVFYYTGSTQTWTKPANAKVVQMVAIGGGSGGGSGRKGAAASARFGGGGGGGGARQELTLVASNVPSTLTLTVGQGGAGGAAVTAADTNGNNGTAGTAAAIVNTGAALYYMFANNSGAGVGGTAAAGNGGAGGPAPGGASGAGSSGASSSGTVVPSDASGTLAGGASGGGAGGGISTGNVAFAGSKGGYGMPIYVNANGGANTGVAGTAGATYGLNAGGGGGGGGASLTGNAGNGANGGNYGAGGGGGGAAVNAVGNSGAGGAGANGVIVMTTYF